MIAGTSRAEILFFNAALKVSDLDGCFGSENTSPEAPLRILGGVCGFPFFIICFSLPSLFLFLPFSFYLVTIFFGLTHILLANDLSAQNTYK